MELKPIENRGEDETRQVKTRRKIGNVVGLLGSIGILGSDKGDTVATVVAGSGLVQQVAGEAAAKIGGPGPATRYMVKVRLDGGKVLAITQLGEKLGDIKVGSRVMVEGSGGDARILAE